MINGPLMLFFLPKMIKHFAVDSVGSVAENTVFDTLINGLKNIRRRLEIHTQLPKKAEHLLLQKQDQFCPTFTDCVPVRLIN